MTREEYEKKKKEGTLTEKEKRLWAIADWFDKLFEGPTVGVINMNTEEQRKFEEEEHNHWYEEECKKGNKEKIEQWIKRLDDKEKELRRQGFFKD